MKMLKRKIKKWLTNKKGLSIIGAALLLIAIVSVFAILYIVSNVFTFEKALIVEAVNFNDCTLTVCIRNTNNETVFITAEYQNDTLVTSNLHHKIPAKGVACFTLTGCYSPGDRVKLVTQGGSQVIFEVQSY